MPKKKTATREWPEKSVRVSNLLLDPLNPRLRNPNADNNQRAVCRDLIENDGIENLARDIATHGYFKTEILVVMKSPDSPSKYVVLEGNRRTAALKLLHAPEFAPDSKKSKFEAISISGKGRIPDAVKVVVVPNRAAARPMMLYRHTNPNILKWTPIAQRRFISEMVGEGITPDELARSMGIPVRQFVQKFSEGKLHELAVAVSQGTDVANQVADPEKFGVTTLARIAESSAGQEWLGLSFDGTQWIIETEKASFRKAFQSVVADIATGEVTSRTVHNAEQIEAYLKGKTRKRLRPKKKSGKAAPAASVTEEPSRKKSKPPAPAPRSTVTAPNALLPSEIDCDLDCPRIHAILREIRNLKVVKTPNAAAMLFRALLDMACQEYLDTTDKTKTLVSKLDKKDQKPDDWMPSLPQMLRYLAEDEDVKLDRVARKALRNFVNDKGTGEITLHGLDGFAHNRHSPPTSAQLEAIAARMRPLLAFLLQKQST